MLKLPGRCSLGFLSILLAPIFGHTAVFNYSSQLENVVVQVDGPVIEYRVFDPDRGRFVGQREGRAKIANLVQTNGIVAYTDGAILYARFYDPNRGAWQKTEVAVRNLDTLVVGAGILAWNDAALVSQLVYDLCRGAWRLNQDAATLEISRLQTADGVVTWNDGRTVYHRAYDPTRGRWVGSSLANATTAENLLTRHGIVAWSSAGIVHARTYDPELGRWVVREIESGAPDRLQVDNGVVAWQSAGRVYFLIYDPMEEAWRGSRVESGPADNLRIRHSTVTFTDRERNFFIRGYDIESGRWFAGITVPFASFGASTTMGAAPKTVYFYDRSIGASGWGWNFGDGDVRFERAPHHTFSEAARFRVALQVHGPHGMPSGATLNLNLQGEAAGEAAGAHAAVDGSSDDYHALESSRTDEGLLQITIHGSAGEEIELQGSSNLADWSTLATLGNSTGTLTYVDPDSAGTEHRFYRYRVINP